MAENKLTIIEQIKDVEKRSSVAFELDITQVANLAERATAITSVDDPEFKSIKKEMQTTRKYVNDYFMDARREFNRLAGFVREVEKTVLDEFTPEENRLIALDKAEKARIIMEARKEALPAKRERITTAGIEFTDEEILAMEDADFELEYATRLQAKLEADRIAEQERIDAENAKLAEREAEIARKQAEQDAIEQARKEERERAEEALRVAKENAEREKREAEERRIAEERERTERAEREKREAEEAETARLAKKKFQDFLKANKYDESTDIINGDKLYRLIATYEK